MVTGAVAAIAYGEPRMTNDVDVVLRLGPNDGDKLIAEYPASAYYVPPLEVIEVRKLESFAQGGSDRHVRDIQGMLRVSGEYVDRDELDRLIAARGLTGQWEDLRGVSG